MHLRGSENTYCDLLCNIYICILKWESSVDVLAIFHTAEALLDSRMFAIMPTRLYGNGDSGCVNSTYPLRDYLRSRDISLILFTCWLMHQLLLVLSPHLIKLKATFPIQAGRDTREKFRS